MRHANHAMRLLASVALAGALVSASMTATGAGATRGSYDDLLALFRDWQRLEQPTLLEGAPDYTASAIARRQAGLAQYQARLASIDDSSWPLEQKIDYELVRAQMNGLDFDIRVLRPWARDPAFYQSVRTEQSDTPAHEGPVHHALIELWQYTFPLSKPDAARLAAQLRTIPPLLSQARGNLTGNAHDLWVTGTGTMQQQVADLADLAGKTSDSGPELKQAIAIASRATADFVTWLQAEAPSKTGPSGIGKDAYNWGLRNVYLVPMTWDDEVMLLKRELARAHASLALRGAAQSQPAAARGGRQRRRIREARQ